MDLDKTTINKTMLNSEGFFDLAENESVVIAVKGVEELNYVVPAGKTAKVHIILNGTEE